MKVFRNRRVALETQDLTKYHVLVNSYYITNTTSYFKLYLECTLTADSEGYSVSEGLLT